MRRVENNMSVATEQPQGVVTAENDDDKSYPSGSNELPVLESLFHSCASITQTALSCPTLGTSVAANKTNIYIRQRSYSSNNKDVNSILYQKEVEYAKWLDIQILDYRAAIGRLRRVATSSNRNTKRYRNDGIENNELDNNSDNGIHDKDVPRKEQSTDLDNIDTLREKLFDESIRINQEQLLVSRMRMTCIAQETLLSSSLEKSTTKVPRDNEFDDVIMGESSKNYGAVADSTCTINSKESSCTHSQEEEAAQIFLYREALRNRDEQAKITLEKIQFIDKIQKQIEVKSKECRMLQERNRLLWWGQKDDDNHDDDDDCGTGINDSDDEIEENKDISNNSDDDLDDHSITKKLEMENLILKRTLLDIITGSGIDWYCNKRIFNTMTKLESMQGGV